MRGYLPHKMTNVCVYSIIMYPVYLQSVKSKFFEPAMMLDLFGTSCLYVIRTETVHIFSRNSHFMRMKEVEIK